MRRQPQRADGGQLVLQLLPVPVGGAGKALAQSRARQVVQVVVHVLPPLRDGEVGVDGAHLAEGEAARAPLGDLAGAADALGGVPPAARHLGRGLQAPLGGGAQQTAAVRLLQRHLAAHGHHQVVHGPPLGGGVVRVVGDRPGDAGLLRQFQQVGGERGLAVGAVVPRLQVQPVAEGVVERAQCAARLLPLLLGKEAGDAPVGTPGEGDEAFGVGGDIVQGDAGGAARAPHPAPGDQGAEVSPPGGVFHNQGEVGAVRQRDFRSEKGADSRLGARLGEADGAPQVVVVGERQVGVAELGGARGERLRVRRAVAQREGAVTVQLYVISLRHKDLHVFRAHCAVVVPVTALSQSYQPSRYQSPVAASR
jgi:hypothetical protein